MAMTASTVGQLIEYVVDTESHDCGCCGERVVPNASYMIVVSRPYVHNGALVVTPETVDGNYAYWPFFLHEDCFLAAIEELQADSCDDQPNLTTGTTVVAECACCGSHVLPGEITGAVYCGKLELSSRCPTATGKVDPQWALDFQAQEGPQFLCPPCLNAFNKEALGGSWSNETIQCADECEAGNKSFCWRTGVCESPTCTRGG